MNVRVGLTAIEQPIADCAPHPAGVQVFTPQPHERLVIQVERVGDADGRVYGGFGPQFLIPEDVELQRQLRRDRQRGAGRFVLKSLATKVNAGRYGADVSRSSRNPLGGM